MLKQNLDVLRARFPVVLQRILQIGSAQPESYSYDDSQSPPKLYVKQGNTKYPAYGDLKKENLCKRWFGNLRLKSESLYVITGFGDGSHIRHFMNHSSKGTNFFVAEKEPSLLRETFARFDVSDILSNDRFMLGAGVCDDQFFKDLQGAAMLSVADVNSVIFSPFHKTDEAYYDKTRNEMVRQYLVIRPLMEVNLRTGINLQENTLENLPIMGSSPDIGELADKFQDVPFILIGAGPSLDESIDFLKKVQDKAIIVASNSPYRKLINSGIRPHLVVTADPMSPTLAGFENVSLEGVPLACPFSAYPEIARRFKGRIISWLSVNPIAEILRKNWGYSKGTPIMEQGTVSGCVLDISRVLGCKKVMLVGQDMCIRDDGKYYTDDSAYSDTGSHYSHITKGHRLPGNTQEKVLVEGRLYVYLKTFEKFISENPSTEYRNLCRTGVKVAGAPYLSYDEALEWIGSDSSSRTFDNEVKMLLENQGAPPNLTESLKPLKGFVERLLELSLSLAIQTEMLPEKFSGTNYSNNKKVLKLLEDSSAVNDLIESNDKFWHCLLDGKTKAELAIYRRIVRDIDFANNNWTALQKNKEYYWALSEGCDWLLSTIEEKTSSPLRETQVTSG